MILRSTRFGPCHSLAHELVDPCKSVKLRLPVRKPKREISWRQRISLPSSKTNQQKIQSVLKTVKLLLRVRNPRTVPSTGEEKKGSVSYLESYLLSENPKARDIEKKDKLSLKLSLPMDQNFSLGTGAMKQTERTDFINMCRERNQGSTTTETDYVRLLQPETSVTGVADLGDDPTESYASDSSYGTWTSVGSSEYETFCERFWEEKSTRCAEKMESESQICARVLEYTRTKLDAWASQGERYYWGKEDESSASTPLLSLSIMNKALPFKRNSAKIRIKACWYDKSRIHGMGLFAAEVISAGEFVLEFLGERIRDSLADVREAMYHQQGVSSIYMIDAGDGKVLDGTRRGGIARYINHSCDPNLECKLVKVGQHTRIYIFAIKRIEIGEELSFDYKLSSEGYDQKVPCYCEARNCRRFMDLS